MFTAGMECHIDMIISVGDQSTTISRTIISNETLLTIAFRSLFTGAFFCLLVTSCSSPTGGDGETGEQVPITLPVLWCSTITQAANINFRFCVDTLLHGLLGADGTVEAKQIKEISI